MASFGAWGVMGDDGVDDDDRGWEPAPVSVRPEGRTCESGLTARQSSLSPEGSTACCAF